MKCYHKTCAWRSGNDDCDKFWESVCVDRISVPESEPKASAPVDSIDWLAIAIKAVEAEPELPGSMPDEMWNAIAGDRDATEEALRICVRQTKAGIIERLLANERGDLHGE